jgi:cation transport ATPase
MTSPQEIVRIAAAAEHFSEHPLARAITGRAAEWSLSVREPENFRYVPGKGILCDVDGVPTAVGTRALMHDEGIRYRTKKTLLAANPKCWLPAAADFWRRWAAVRAAAKKSAKG